MSVVMGIYGLIRDLMTEAEKAKDDKLYSSLIDIKKQVNELDEENQRLKKQLDIREKMIPMANKTERGYLCRICEEVWMKGIPRK